MEATRWLLLLALGISFRAFSQATPCDSVFHQAFYHFVTYDDSVGYSLEYRMETNETCLLDTVDFLHFLISERYVYANSEAIRAESNWLSTHPFCYLAHHTNHRKIQPSSDSSYTDISDLSAIRKGAGRQFTRSLPVEVLRLYYVSALFYQNFQFKHEIVLVQGEKTVTTTSYTDPPTEPGRPKIVRTVNGRILKRAFRSYQKWLDLVDQYGLPYVRNKGIDPLDFSKGIHWRDQENESY